MREFGKGIELADLRPFDIISTEKENYGECLVYKIDNEWISLILNIQDTKKAEIIWRRYETLGKMILTDIMVKKSTNTTNDN